ncbi:MAG: AMIN domain-containing protein [Cyanobacteria bacterium J06635_10]
MDKQFKNRQFIKECKRLISALLLSSYAIIALDTNSSIAAPRVQLENWRFYPQSSELEISLSAPSQPQYFYLSQPPRIVVDLPDTKLGNVSVKQDYNGAIQRIRVSQLNENVTRIVMDLAPGTFFDRNRVQLQPISPQNPTLWVFRPLIGGNGNYLPPGNLSIGNDLPLGNYSPPQPTNSPYNQQLPRILPPPRSPGNLPNRMYNPSLIPHSVNTLPNFATPQTLPPVNINNGNRRQPTVTVPPITNNNLAPQIPNSLPPATPFPSPTGNFNSSPSFFQISPSNVPATPIPNNPLTPPLPMPK